MNKSPPPSSPSQPPPAYNLSQDQYRNTKAVVNPNNSIAPTESAQSEREDLDHEEIHLGRIGLSDDEFELEMGRTERREHVRRHRTRERYGRRVSKVLYVPTLETIVRTITAHVTVTTAVAIIALTAYYFSSTEKDEFFGANSVSHTGRRQHVWHLLASMLAVYIIIIAIVLLTPRQLDSRFTIVVYTAAASAITGGGVFAMITK